MREGGDQEGGPPASRRRGDRVGVGGGPIAITGADARPCRYSSDLSHASTLSHAPCIATF